MVCKNLNLRPKNKHVRNFFGSMDYCPYLEEKKGITIHILSKDECSIQKLCKHYEEK